MTSSDVVGCHDVGWPEILHLSELFDSLGEVAVIYCKESAVEVVKHVEHFLWFAEALLLLKSPKDRFSIATSLGRLLVSDHASHGIEIPLCLGLPSSFEAQTPCS